MLRATLLASAALFGLSLAAPAIAQDFGRPGPGPGIGPDGPLPRALPRRGYGPRAQMLPPDVPYRDPRVMRMRPRRPVLAPPQPDFLIQAYLPRPTDLPMYNEPPQRFPQR